MSRSLSRLLGLIPGVVLTGCAVLSPLPDPVSVQQRITQFPIANLPLEHPVQVHWDEHMVPFIEAETDQDLAFTLGLVHAHLRLGQMEILRRISQGRLGEMAGPLVSDIDHSLRILNFGRAAKKTLAIMPPETRSWLDAFVSGVNHYIETMEVEPHEFRVLNIKRAPWTPEDVLTLGRLASSDVNWFVWFRTFELRQRDDWPEIWANMVEKGGDSVVSFNGLGAADRLAEILGGVGKTGSNSVAVAASRSATGSALMANDPHLGILLPNVWLIAGYKSPSHHAVGLMVPGLPFIAVGRNPKIAWGGTNMRAATSDLVDVSDLPPDQIESREEILGMRFWFDSTITVRETPYGPIMSDAPAIETGETPDFAIRWRGHDATDEMSAMLAANRARDFGSFRRAFQSFGVSGQNMLYADEDGNIGMVLAVQLPRRPTNHTPPDVILKPSMVDAHWADIVDATDLPFQFNPSEGFIASSNNKPADGAVPVGFFFSADDRITRLQSVLGDTRTVSLEMLKSLQRDVYVASAPPLRDAFVRVADGLATPGAGTELLRVLAGWDGHYRAEDQGPVAFELLLNAFAERFLAKRFESEALRAGYASQAGFNKVLLEDLEKAEVEDRAGLRSLLSEALTAAAKDLSEFPTWGDMHRLVVAHPMSNIPVIGDRYRFVDVPVGGTTTALMKTAHGLTNERHRARYGSQSRHVSDLADMDANWFTLLGGQDGWLNSAAMVDQVTLWREGHYIKVPLRPETARADFAYHLQLAPKTE